MGVNLSLLDARRPRCVEEAFYCAGVTDGGTGLIMRARGMPGQNQTTIATTRTQNQNHRRRVCLPGCTLHFRADFSIHASTSDRRNLTAVLNPSTGKGCSRTSPLLIRCFVNSYPCEMLNRNMAATSLTVQNLQQTHCEPVAYPRFPWVLSRPLTCFSDFCWGAFGTFPRANAEGGMGCPQSSGAV
jgi:hypothetical protein